MKWKFKLKSRSDFKKWNRKLNRKMDIKNSSGLVGKYNDKDVYVTTRKEYDDGATHHQNSYYILKDHLTIDGYFALLLHNKIIGYCKNDGGIKIYDKEVPYVRASVSINKEYKLDTNRREYKYTTKDAPQLSKEEYLSIEALAQKVNDIIKDGLAAGNKLLKEEQDRAQSLCDAPHHK